jgi:hypothetical protein
LQEEALDVLILDVLALGEDAEDGQRREVGDLAELVEDFWHKVLLAQFWLDEVLEGVNPKIDLIGAMLLAEVDDILVPIAGDVEVEEVLAHAEVLTEHDDAVIEVVHLEEGEEDVVIWFFGGVVELLEYLSAVLLPLRGVLLHHLEVELDEPVEHYLLVRQLGHVLDQVEQEVLQVGAVDDEKAEELVGLLEGSDGERLQLLSVHVQLLEHCPLLRGQHVVALLPAHHLTDRVRADQQLDQLNRLLRHELHELLPELNHVLLLLLQRHLRADVLQRPAVVLLVFNQDLEVQLVLRLLLCQFHGFVVVLQVFADLDGSLDIEEVALQTAFREEMAEVFNLLFLDVAVEEEGSVLLLGLLFLVDALQVLDEVVDLGDVEELADDVGGLDEAESEDVLLDGAGEVALGVEQVAVQARDLGQQRLLAVLVFSEPPRLVVEGTLEEGLDLEGVVLLEQRQDDALALLVAHHQRDRLVVGEHCLHLRVRLEERDVLVHRVQDLHEVLVVALLVLLVLLLESHHDQVVVPELFDHLRGESITFF